MALITAYDNRYDDPMLTLPGADVMAQEQKKVHKLEATLKTEKTTLRSGEKVAQNLKNSLKQLGEQYTVRQTELQTIQADIRSLETQTVQLQLQMEQKTEKQVTLEGRERDI